MSLDLNRSCSCCAWGPSSIATQVFRTAMSHLVRHRSLGDKGRFRKRVVLANVPSFRFSFRGNMRTYPRSGFSFRGNIRTYPRSGFRSGGTSAKTTLVEMVTFGRGPLPSQNTFSAHATDIFLSDVLCWGKNHPYCKICTEIDVNLSF